MSTDEVNPYAYTPVESQTRAAEPWTPVYADRGARLVARIIDRLALIVPAVLFGEANKFVPSEDVDAGTVLWTLAATFWLSGFACVQWVLLAVHGQSIGKRMLRIRIVGLDGKPPGFLRAVIRREGARLLPAAIPYLGPMIGMVDSLSIFAADRRTLHDQVAGTMVVRANGGAPERPAPP